MIKYIKRKLLERRVIKPIDKANERHKLKGTSIYKLERNAIYVTR